VSGSVTSKTDDGFGNPIFSSGYGALKIVGDGSPLFQDPFNGTSLDTNQWTTAVSGTGSSSVSGGYLNLTTGTTANNNSRVISIPTLSNQGDSFIIEQFDLKLEATILTNAYRFWGRATESANLLYDGIGFEIDTSANLNAVVYAAGTKIFSQTLTKPTDGAVHRYWVISRPNLVNWYFDTLGTSVATANFQTPNTNARSVYFRLQNGSTGPTSAPTFQITETGISDTSSTNTQIIDSTYPWRKAKVSPNQELQTKDIINTTTQSQVITLAANTPVEAKGGSTRLANRKVLVVSSVNGNYFWNTVSGVTSGTGFPLFKNQIYPMEYGDNVPVYIVSSVSGVQVLCNEGS
jgi:hypothetical protein